MPGSLHNSSPNNLTSRKATEADVQLLFSWANEESVRRNAFNTDPIDWNTHVKWFSKRLDNPNCFIHIFYFGEKPVGQVRIEKETDQWRIDYSVDAAFRGKGYGKKMISEIINLYPMFTFLAEVKMTNIPSVMVFEALGFRKMNVAAHIYKFQYPF